MKNLLTLLSLACLLLVSNVSYATTTTLTGEKVEATTTLSKKELKKQERLQKRMAKIDKKIAKKMENAEDIDFSDPTEKWMWFWIFGWALAIILPIIGIALVSTGGSLTILFTLLAAICGVFGTASLVIWLIKKFA